MKHIVLAFLFFCSSAFADCEQFVAWGFPTQPANSIALCQIAFFTQWDVDTKNPSYSAEFLIEENVSGQEDRKGTFKPHPNTPVGRRSTNADYLKSGYDRGHLAPAGDMRKDSAAMAQSFYLSNIIPQLPILNRRFWKSLESQVRTKVTPDRPLYVITGPIYVYPPRTIGNNVWVPSYTYKIIYDKNSNMMASYMMPNELTISGKTASFFVSLETIEQYTGQEFFPKMPPEVKAALKQVELKSWN